MAPPSPRDRRPTMLAVGRPTMLAVAGAALALVLVVALVAVLAVLALRPADGTTAAAPTATPSATATQATVSDLYQAVAPSVVVVRTADGALGSGVVTAADGTILTANHVVADGSAVTVTFADGTTSRATVASTDTDTDVATLTPATLPQVLVPATIGRGVQVGSDVVAIGNPLGLTDSVSAGVVSGLDRTGSTDGGTVEGLIQFDAAVNPGSSGGPLLDAAGNVVGIVVSIADPGDDGAFAGIGFAVPIGSALGAAAGGGPQV